MEHIKQVLLLQSLLLLKNVFMCLGRTLPSNFQKYASRFIVILGNIKNQHAARQKLLDF